MAKWDRIIPDFLTLSREQQLELIKYTRAERRKVYVKPEKPVKQPKPIELELDGTVKVKKTRKKKQEQPSSAIAALLIAELKRRKDAESGEGTTQVQGS